MSPEPAQAHIRIAASIAEIGREAWDACANPLWLGPKPLTSSSDTSRTSYNPFISYDFLSSLEESGAVHQQTGWLPQHLVVETPSGDIAALMPAYLKSHSRGEYVFDFGWAEAFQRAGGRYYPKLQVSVPFTPATGPRLLARPGAGQDANRTSLVLGAAELAARLSASSVHATFLEEKECRIFAQAGYLIRTDRQFHFVSAPYSDFDDFLEALSSRKRKAIRRERRDALAGGVEVELLTGASITEADWDAFFAFYMDTGSRKWGQPYLNRKFFSLIGEKMADRILLVIAKRQGHRIAGALNFIGSDTLYGRYWGALEEQPFLHFELCYYQAIEWGLLHGMKRVEAGAQGEHKLARGYAPHSTYSAHWIKDPAFRRAIADFLERERAEVESEAEMLAQFTPFKRSV